MIRRIAPFPWIVAPLAVGCLLGVGGSGPVGSVSVGERGILQRVAALHFDAEFLARAKAFQRPRLIVVIMEMALSLLAAVILITGPWTAWAGSVIPRWLPSYSFFARAWLLTLIYLGFAALELPFQIFFYLHSRHAGLRHDPWPAFLGDWMKGLAIGWVQVLLVGLLVLWLLAAFPRREDSRDCVVTREGGTLADLPKEAAVGTSSLRRRVQLLAQRADLRIEAIRGNVETRLAKLESGAYDAIVLARAGLSRLGLAPAHAFDLAADEFVPAVGQGVLGLEIRVDDMQALEMLSPLDDPLTSSEAHAERAFLHQLRASCHTPVAGHARREGESLAVTGLVASPDGVTVLRASISGPAASADALGRKLADELLGRGAGRLLALGEGPRS